MSSTYFFNQTSVLVFCGQTTLKMRSLLNLHPPSYVDWISSGLYVDHIGNINIISSQELNLYLEMKCSFTHLKICNTWFFNQKCLGPKAVKLAFITNNLFYMFILPTGETRKWPNEWADLVKVGYVPTKKNLRFIFKHLSSLVNILWVKA